MGVALQFAMRFPAGTQDLADEVVGGIFVLRNEDFALIFAIVKRFLNDRNRRDLRGGAGSATESPPPARCARIPERGAFASRAC